MTEERNKWAVSLAASMKRCAEPKLPCDGCLFDHVCDHQEENGTDIMLSGAAMIEELLGELNYLNTVNGHLKEMAGKGADCRGADAPRNDSEREGVSKGWEWQIGLYERTIAEYGVKKQVTKAVEEMGELLVELSRWQNADNSDDQHLLAHIREELADVCIMCDQLQLIFGDVSDWEMYKLERLERKLERGL